MASNFGRLGLAASGCARGRDGSGPVYAYTLSLGTGVDRLSCRNKLDGNLLARLGCFGELGIGSDLCLSVASKGEQPHRYFRTPNCSTPHGRSDCTPPRSRRATRLVCLCVAVCSRVRNGCWNGFGLIGVLDGGDVLSPFLETQKQETIAISFSFALPRVPAVFGPVLFDR